MTREEAETRRVELAAEDPAHTWLVRERDGQFEVVKVGLPGQKRLKLTTTTEAAPNPPARRPAYKQRAPDPAVWRGLRRRAPGSRRAGVRPRGAAGPART